MVTVNANVKCSFLVKLFCVSQVLFPQHYYLCGVCVCGNAHLKPLKPFRLMSFWAPNLGRFFKYAAGTILHNVLAFDHFWLYSSTLRFWLILLSVASTSGGCGVMHTLWTIRITVHLLRESLVKQSLFPSLPNRWSLIAQSHPTWPSPRPHRSLASGRTAGPTPCSVWDSHQNNNSQRSDRPRTLFECIYCQIPPRNWNVPSTKLIVALA